MSVFRHFRLRVVFGQGLNFNLDMSVLTLTPSLFDIFILYFRFARNSFFVRHLRFADISFDGKFALHTVYDNFKMKFTHTHDDRLTRFLV